MYLTVRQLETLVAIADARSFSEAAARLGISQPSLSETVKRVEEELGVRVFERTTRSLSLTPEGEHAVIVAREAVRDFRLALESIDDRTQGRRGRSSVRCECSSAIPRSLPPTHAPKKTPPPLKAVIT